MKMKKPVSDESGVLYEIKMDDIRKARKSMANTKAHVVTGDIVTSNDAPVSERKVRPLK